MYKQSRALFFWDLFETNLVTSYAFLGIGSGGATLAGLISPHALAWISVLGGLLVACVKASDSKISQYFGEPSPDSQQPPKPPPAAPPASQPDAAPKIP